MGSYEHIKVIPTPDELSRVERDLRFHPVTTMNPKRLTSGHIDTFNRDGVIKGFRVFSNEEIEGYRRYFDSLLDDLSGMGESHCAINEAHLQHAGVYDVLRHPRIVTYVKDLLGNHVIGWGAHYFCKPPHDANTIPWHQDAVYWPLTPSKTVNVWLALDDADLDNACMRFIVGSHRYGRITGPPGSSQELSSSMGEPLDQYGQIAAGELRAGEISIHSDLVLHASGANRSNRRRARLALRYCTPDVCAYLGWYNKGVVISGHDASGRWANPPRPTVD